MTYVYTISFKSFWNDYYRQKKSISQMGAACAHIIINSRAYRLHKHTLNEIIHELVNCTTLDEFNIAIASLYDWGDQLVTAAYPLRLCWIITE